MPTSANKTPAKKRFDIVLFGATGFTGQLTAKYLAEHAPPKAKIGLAARNLTKLQHIKNQLSQTHPRIAEFDMLHAETECDESLTGLAQATQVVITTVGPYIQHGSKLVKACACEGTDYVDLTGEPEFVDRMRGLYHKEATNRAARIVNSCGFDSIPHDLGVLYTINELTKKHGDLADKTVEISGYVSAGGRFSGGTWHSAVTAFSRFREHNAFKAQHHKKLSINTGNRKVSASKPRLHKALDAWAVPFPSIDPQVVRRSGKLNPAYGKKFIYDHNILTSNLAKAVGGMAFVGGVFALAQLKPTRKLLLKQVKQGEGPSDKQIESGWFTVKFTTKVDGKPSLQTEVSGGDPGYGETSKMLAESALCLAFDRNALPENYGITTPAAAMGNALMQRLQTANIEFKVV